MILPTCVVHSRTNWRSKFSGLDRFINCRDKQHFINYQYNIDYAFNSRGFRDSEWPQSIEELQSAIWCIGDSFTVGLGQPFDHIWPQVLSKAAGQRTVNVSMEGASNDWIFRKVQDIMRDIKPKHLILMWSYTHRRESSDRDKSDEARRIPYSGDTNLQDIDHWLELSNKIKAQYPLVVQSAIPKFAYAFSCPLQTMQKTWNEIKDISWPECPQNVCELEDLPDNIRLELKNLHGCYDDMQWLLRPLPDHVIYIDKQLDYARDYHHFDILTSRWVVNEMLRYL